MRLGLEMAQAWTPGKSCSQPKLSTKVTHRSPLRVSTIFTGSCRVGWAIVSSVLGSYSLQNSLD